MNNQSSWLFIHGSRRFYEGVDWVQSLVHEPDDGKIDQFFRSPKRQIETLDELVTNENLSVGEAEERRLRIEIPAWRGLHKYILNSWNSKDKLAEVFAEHRRAVSGEELRHPDAKEDLRRKEALRKFNDVWCEIITRHQVAL